MKSTEKVRAYFSPVGRIRMLGDHPALDLANTLHWRDGELLNFIPSYAALVDWAEVAGLLTKSEQAKLLARAPHHSSEASTIHLQWLELRDALKAWLPGIDGLEQSELQNCKDDSAARKLKSKIAAVTDDSSLASYLAVETSEKNHPTVALPLLRSATAIWNLMTFPPAGHIRQCEADNCGGFFVDQSRAKPRRWCSMDSCGNRAKAQRHRKSVALQH